MNAEVPAIRPKAKATDVASSFIRTLTVGFGITPNLLTSRKRALAG